MRLRRSERGYVLVAHCRLDPAATVESVHRRVDDLERLVRDRKPEIARIVIHAEPKRERGEYSRLPGLTVGDPVP